MYASSLAGRNRSGSSVRSVLAVLVAALLIALALPAAALAINPVVTFPDPALDSAVRSAIGVPSGDIHESDLTTFTTLVANGAGIHYLDGLDKCTALTHVDLYNNDIATITALASDHALQYVDLQGNQIADISALSSPTALTYVNVSANNITTITALAGQTGLQHLDVDNNNSVSDLSPIAGLINLRWFAAYHCAVTDLTPVRGKTQLTVLWVGQNPGLTDVSALATMTALTDVDLGYDPVPNVSPLANLTNLTSLDLYDDWVLADISPLANLTHLNWLNVSQSQVWDVSPLAHMHGGAPDKVWLQTDWIDTTPGGDAAGVIQTLTSRGYDVHTDPQRSGGAIVGAVHTAAGAVLGGVRVQLTDGPGANTGSATGTYTIGLAKPGVRTLTFTKQYYATVTTTLGVTVSTTQTVNATMTPLVLNPALARTPSKSSISYKRKHGRATFTLGATLRDGRGAVAGAYVWLQKKSGRTWKTLYKLKTTPSGAVSRKIAATHAGSTSYRWYAPATALDNATSTGSQKVSVK
jgi:Leucine-rich repeat (LRR) protein